MLTDLDAVECSVLANRDPRWTFLTWYYADTRIFMLPRNTTFVFWHGEERHFPFYVTDTGRCAASDDRILTIAPDEVPHDAWVQPHQYALPFPTQSAELQDARKRGHASVTCVPSDEASVDADAPRMWTDLVRHAAIAALVAWTTRLVLTGMSARSWSAQVLCRISGRRATVVVPPQLSPGVSKRKKRNAAAANAPLTLLSPTPRPTTVDRGTDPSSPVRKGAVDVGGTDPVRICKVSHATQTTAANAPPTLLFPTTVDRGTVDAGTDPIRICTVSHATQTTTPNAEVLLARATERIERVCRRTANREDGRYVHGQATVPTTSYMGQAGTFPTQYDMPAFYGWMPYNWYGCSNAL